jgi:hypothetical protein
VKPTTVVIGLSVLFLSAVAGMSAKDSPGKESVDSGSFGVFANGQRVATEAFSVQKRPGGISVVASQIKQEGTGDPMQSSEMQISADGSLIRYEWHELAPGKAEIVLAPNNDFLKETVTQNPGEKPAEQPFLMPRTSVVMDNNFFVHREVLAWRYLASSCVSEGSQAKCAATPFGTIVPQERISVRVNVQLIGPDKVTIRGVEHQLVRMNFKTEDDEWSLWVDPQDHFKLMRLTKSGTNVEVVRD